MQTSQTDTSLASGSPEPQSARCSPDSSTNSRLWRDGYVRPAARPRHSSSNRWRVTNDFCVPTPVVDRAA